MAATASSTSQPQEEGFKEICGLLEHQMSPATSDKSQIWQQLQHYSHFPDFNNYLTFIFARAEGKSVDIRQAAGLLLKNNLRAAFKNMPLANQQYIKSELLPSLGGTDRHIRSTAGTIISVLVQIEGYAGWPELLHALVSDLDSNDSNHMEGGMDALSKICEDVPSLLDSDIPGLSERPITILLPRLLQLFQSPHASLRKLSLSSVNQFIMLMPTVLLLSMDKYLQGLFLLANDPAPDVRKLVCMAFVQLVEVRPAFLEPHLRNVIEYILQVNKDPDDEVALEACEFWSAYCDAPQLPPENLIEFLPRLIPVLLSNMVYADDDESLLEAEEDGSLPDREQDLKPRFHSSRFHGSEDGEDDDEDIVNLWNLRKCSAAALDILSNVFGDDILPALMPVVQVPKEISPIVLTVVSCLVPILQHAEGLNKSLIENSAITLGRLAWVCPELVSPHMEHFMQAWCVALSMIRDDIEKEDAFRGLCAVVKANPAGALNSLVFMCKAIASWHEIKSEDLHNEICQVLHGYKQMLKNGAWEQCMSALEPSVKGKLLKYQV